MVDAPSRILEFMPLELKNSMEILTHEVLIDPNNEYRKECQRLENLSRQFLERYRNEATLVVTSRLHCAAPCLAMGIPVILARNYFDDRYSWIDRFLPLYTPDRFPSIDWNPTPYDLTAIKQLLFSMGESMLSNGPDLTVNRAVHSFYQSRKREKIMTPFVTKSYFWLHGKYPKLADYIREVLLQRFTVASGRK